MEGFRSRFILDVVETALRRSSALGLTRLQQKLPPAARAWLIPTLEQRANLPEVAPLDEATTLLLQLDEQLGVGSGQFLEGCIADVVTSLIARDVATLATSTPRTLVLRLVPVVQAPWVGVEPQITVTEGTNFLHLSLGVPAQPRATRLLIHHLLGTLSAARQLGPLRHTESQRPVIEWFGDRARLDLPLRHPESLMPPRNSAAPPPSRPSQRSLPRAPSLSEQVESILGRRDSDPRLPRVGAGPSSVPSPEGDSQREVPVLRGRDSQPSLRAPKVPVLPVEPSHDSLGDKKKPPPPSR